MTWKLSDIASILKNSFQAILKGELLLRLNVGRYLVEVIYTFFLFGLVIWISLMIETSMANVEKNKATLRELEIVHSQKVYEVANAGRRSTVIKSLEELGSDVKEPEAPANIIGN